MGNMLINQCFSPVFAPFSQNASSKSRSARRKSRFAAQQSGARGPWGETGDSIPEVPLCPGAMVTGGDGGLSLGQKIGWCRENCWVRHTGRPLGTQ